MTDLTEQWKKGELPSGYYYVKNEFGCIFPTDYSEEYDSINDVVVKDFWTEVSDIIEVIAPVPSYEEWQKLNWYAGNGVEENQELKMENTKLKELLKQARGLMNTTKDWACTEATENMIAKIDKALGEDK